MRRGQKSVTGNGETPRKSEQDSDVLFQTGVSGSGAELPHAKSAEEMEFQERGE